MIILGHIVGSRYCGYYYHVMKLVITWSDGQNTKGDVDCRWGGNDDKPELDGKKRRRFHSHK